MIKHIIFDLDCTLYSIRYGLEENVSRLIKENTAAWLGLPLDESEQLRREALKHYGTTIEWLIYEKGFTDIARYHSLVHPENEADNLPPDPELRKFLEGLPCPCSILTNSPGFHADRIIGKLGLEGIFKLVINIEDIAHRGKPNASSYYRILNAFNLKPEEALFIDDHPRYVEAYLALGGRGLLIDELDRHENYPHERIKNIRELVRFLD